MGSHTISVASITYLSLICLFQSSHADKPTAYEMLQRYNFPIGVLPKGVTGYDLDESTGKFSAYLNGSCAFSLEGSYQLNYKPQSKEVDRNGDDLNFSVGIASAGFSVDSFEECPQCGCGLNCGDRRVRNVRTNPLGLSSSF